MPEWNIEGGVRYPSQLLKMFGGTELALVASNGALATRSAMPAARYLDGETRDCVKRVVGRIDAIQ